MAQRRGNTPQNKPIDKAEIRRRAAAFVKEWSDETDEQREAQSWWNALFEVFGARRHGQAVFEATATRFSTAGSGRIDCFMPGVFVGEAKSAGKIDAAYRQMVDYLAGGSITEAEQPRYLLGTDFSRIRLWDRDEPADPHDLAVPSLDISIADLPQYIESFAFLAGHRKPREERNLEAASVKAAKRLAELKYEMYGRLAVVEGEADEVELEQAVFLTRLLFMLYGDDVDGMWDRGQFYRLIDERTADNGSDVQGTLLALFQVLATPRHRRDPNLPEELAAFPYVNGGLFNNFSPVPPFNTVRRRALLDACRVDWKELSPAIFGSLFQGLATKEQRRKSGEHYTSEKNILKTLGPLFLDEVEDQLESAWFNYDQLESLRAHLGNIKVFDPACGCGNFLVTAYARLASVERRILERQRDMREDTSRMLEEFTAVDLRVVPRNFAGIEVSWWPAKIAETAMFLTQHRTTQELTAIGVPPEVLPISDQATIVHGDALAVEWRDVIEPSATTYIAGNPPFLGHETRTAEQATQLRAAWGRDDISRLDFVTAWHAKALDYFDGIDSRFALVTTNSITQGDQVAPLFGAIFAKGWRIRFAHQTFAWESEASGKAAVHCVIVGFDRRTRDQARLYRYETSRSEPSLVVVPQISPYLVPGTETVVHVAERPISPEIAEAAFGAMPRDDGGLIVELDQIQRFRADPVASKYLRSYIGSRELVRGLDRWCLWMEHLDPADVAKSSHLRERIDHVRAFRAKSSAGSTRQMADTPHLFGQMGVRYDEPYLCVASVFSERYRRVPARLLGPEVVASNLAFTISDRDGFAFALVSSRAFLLWQHTIGGRLESRIRFGATTTWNTFPLPPITADARSQLADLGAAIIDARMEHPGASLEDFYLKGVMPAALARAHRALDRALESVLGLPADAPDDTLVAHLLALYDADPRK